jgi:hypothetical protein
VYTASNMINTNNCMLIATVEHTYLRFKLGKQSVDIVSATDPLDCVFMCRSSRIALCGSLSFGEPELLGLDAGRNEIFGATIAPS